MLHPIMQRTKRLRGQRKMLARELSCRLGVSGKNGRGEPGVLNDGPRAHLSTKGFRLKAQTHVVANSETQVGELAILGRRGDGLVYLEIGESRRFAIAKRHFIAGHRAGDARGICLGVPDRRGSGYLLLHEGAKI